MKLLALLPVTLIVTGAVFVLMKMRKQEHEKAGKRSRFQDIKLQVTYDVLSEYENERRETQNLLDKTQNDHKVLEEEVNMLKTKTDKIKGDVDICNGGQKAERDKLASVETESSNLKAEMNKEMSSWKAELEKLRKQLAMRSVVCDYLKKGSEAVSKLCVGEVAVAAPNKEEPKAEAPKKEEQKAEAPEKAEAKAEAPKKEEPKAEAPKIEEPKAAAPKKEETKAEVPKKEEPKAEDPKKEAPKRR